MVWLDEISDLRHFTLKQMVVSVKRMAFNLTDAQCPYFSRTLRSDFVFSLLLFLSCRLEIHEDNVKTIFVRGVSLIICGSVAPRIDVEENSIHGG